MKHNGCKSETNWNGKIHACGTGDWLGGINGYHCCSVYIADSSDFERKNRVGGHGIRCHRNTLTLIVCWGGGVLQSDPTSQAAGMQPFWRNLSAFSCSGHGSSVQRGVWTNLVNRAPDCWRSCNCSACSLRRKKGHWETKKKAPPVNMYKKCSR